MVISKKGVESSTLPAGQATQQLNERKSENIIKKKKRTKKKKSGFIENFNAMVNAGKGE